ncbi:MAG TPA: TIGR02302 family protein [Hyphomicrobiaceae bacterium]|nr:TIGR02302 family protein [Hyphomicrobiaceae bacterium]
MPGRTFERKVRLSRVALFFERLWPRLWLAIAVVGLFLLVSLADVWPHLSVKTHQLVLALFGLALLATLIYAARVPWPSREAAVRRIERRSGLPHRPATTYEDTITLGSDDPSTRAIWAAHRRRLSDLVARLRVGTPEPRTDRHDPLAMRALLLLSITLLLILAGDAARDRLMGAFRFGSGVLLSEARIDAWVTPPAYTAKPPILLADGSHRAFAPAVAAEPIDVPANSILIVRSSGANAATLSADLRPEQGQVEPLPAGAAVAASEVSEVRVTLKQSGPVRILGNGSELVRWTFNVIPDRPPKITLTKEPETSRRGTMKLTYKVEDDYGVAAAEVRFERLPPDPDNPRTAWARAELKGPRLPYERPPALGLRLPRNNAKDAETTSQHELASHPWSGLKVRMMLIARDHAGNIGRTEPIEMKVAERHFYKPLARAVIEQRRKLAEDSRYRLRVARAIDALTLEPETFIRDRNVYLGLRSVYHRLLRDKTRAGLKSASDQLWHIALRIEDGRGLSDAERRLRDIQDQLSRALQEGASDEEIRRLMQELRQALAEFMQQLAEQAQELPEGLSQDMQVLRPEDLDRLLNDLENMARQGSREMAQDMLNQLRNLLEQLQSGRFARGQPGQGQQMMQMLNEFGELIGRQQRLMDDTYGAQRQEGEQGQGEQGQGQGRRHSPGELGERQGQLRDQLGRLQRGLQQFGQPPSENLRDAGEAMDNARRALEQGDLETATREQGRALDQLRQGAQQMAEQMLRQMPSRYGQGPAADAPRDPLGRPQRSQGPDLGTTVKVPDEIDMQRAREILEELRRRLGDQTRPLLELDYIERLLRRF